MGKRKTGNLQDRGTSFRIRYVDNDGIRHAESYKTREEAEHQLTIRLAEMAQGLPASSRPNTVLFGELADDVLTDYEVNGFRSIDDIETRFRLHLIPVFGRRKASQITTAQIKHYVAARQREGAKAGTINRELEAMRHTFNLAIQGRKLHHSPHVPMLREDNVRSGFFTRDEVDRLCAQLSEPLRSFVLFAFLTGWRLEEIRSLLWRNLDFVAGEIRLDAGTTKNREGRVFPMTSELRDLLNHMIRPQPAVTVLKVTAIPVVKEQKVWAHGTGFVFQYNGNPIGEFRKTWKTACYRAGLPCVVEPIRIRGHQQFNADGSPKVRVVKALRIFHDLRRSAARELQRQGYTDGQIMRMCGWATRSVFDRYNVVTDEDIRERMRMIEAARHNSSNPASLRNLS